MATKPKMSGLGRGLDALLGDFEEAPKEGARQVDIYLIDTNAEQPRKAFDEEKLKELSESIRRHGVVQPIIARKNGERYTIVAGERRFRAARMAGLTQVPIIVKDMNDAEVMEIALVENLQREDLNPIEEAAGIRFLMQQHDLTQEEVSARLAKSRPAIANSLRLLTLPNAVQDMLREGALQSGHARALVAVKDPERQAELARRIAEEGLSVRTVENLTKEKDGEEQKKKKTAPVRADANVAAAEERLRERLGTRVLINGDAQKGRIVIEYNSPGELQDLYEAIMGREG